MTILDTLITNRTGGYYNAADLNRVESAVEYVTERLNTLPHDLLDYLAGLNVAPDVAFEVPYSHPITNETKTDWIITDIPTESDTIRYIGNARQLTEAIPIESNLPTNMNHLTWRGANEIERALQAEYQASLNFENATQNKANRTAAAWVYCGDIFCGEA